MARSLVILPEIHTKRRETEAANLAREFKSNPGGQVKLFVEGVRTLQTEEASKSLGFPVTSIEDDRIKTLTTNIAAASTILRYNVFMWAISHKEDADAKKFLSEIVKLTAEVRGTQPGATVSLRDMLEILVTDMVHATQPLIESGALSEKEYEEISKDIPANGKEGFAPKVIALLERFAKETAQMEIKRGLNSLSDLINDFFSERYGFRVRIAGEVYEIAEIFNTPFDQNLASLMQTAEQSYNRLKVFRELYMAYCIAREPFDIGVLNIGINHVQSQNLIPLLQRTDIVHIKVVGQRKDM